jgi:hypothetical protein
MKALDITAALLLASMAAVPALAQHSFAAEYTESG